MAGFLRRFNRNLTNRIGKAFNKIVGSFLGFDQGVFVVKHGKHEISVPLKICTNRVWISIDQNRIDGCAQNPVDYVGYRLFRDKVTFFIDVQSEQCRVSWFANEDHGDRNRWDRWQKEHDRMERERNPRREERREERKEDKKGKR